MPNNYKNYAELVQYRGVQDRNKLLYTFLKDGEEEQERLTFGSLYDISKGIAGYLQTKFVPKNRVLLLFPAGLDFIKAFTGCLLAHIIPIPLALPRQRQPDLTSLLAVAQHASISGIITLSTINKYFKLNETFSTIDIINIDQLQFASPSDYTPVEINENDIAFLQYTSGSTGNPKGVMVSHGNLLHNQKLIQTHYEVSPESIFMSWLPHYHDMGLVGTLLHQLYSGCQTILMSPTAFLQKPFRWLNAVTEYGATISGAPNFAYELCIKRISEEQKKCLDLTRWKIAFNGAEKVNPETLHKFTDAFAECGFKLNQFYPTYGLAESTLLVSGGEILENPVLLAVDRKQLENNKVLIVDQDKSDAQLLVSSGKPSLELEIGIVNPESHTLLTSSDVGEIWVKSPSVALGYWEDPEKTSQHFQAYLKNGEGPFFRTGDTGFIHNENLFVTGRIKDLIIIRGRNIYPEDIETSVQEVDKSLRTGSGAAFSIEIENQEQLFLIQEIERTAIKHLDSQTVFQKINKTIMNKFDLQIYGVILIMPQTLVKTTSGKIKRIANKKMLLDHKLPYLSYWAFNESIKQQLFQNIV